MLINQFIKLAGYKLNLEKSVLFLCTGKEQSENEIKKISFTTVLKRIKYLGMNLTKMCQTCTVKNTKHH